MKVSNVRTVAAVREIGCEILAIGCKQYTFDLKKCHLMYLTLQANPESGRSAGYSSTKMLQ